MDPLSQLETLTSFCHKVDRANRHKISKDKGDLNTINQLDIISTYRLPPTQQNSLYTHSEQSQNLSML